MLLEMFLTALDLPYQSKPAFGIVPWIPRPVFSVAPFHACFECGARDVYQAG